MEKYKQYQLFVKYLILLGYNKGAKVYYDAERYGGEYEVEGFSSSPNREQVLLVTTDKGLALTIFDIPTKEFSKYVKLTKPQFPADEIYFVKNDSYTDFVLHKRWYIGDVTKLDGGYLSMRFYQKPYLFQDDIPEYIGNVEILQDGETVFGKFQEYVKYFDFESEFNEFKKQLGILP